ncbi:fungal specific transcription factor domain protein [Aspergillus arachidicola]|uniref:Fungal specific transcription factor domain protein n=2 Tax=Aspergillus arachidicola TaxID=656916 RepID=A0A2G7FTZ9_9EURO|nr:fungal specific transcription factor domain protein [Aspergillus arachidicola]
MEPEGPESDSRESLPIRRACDQCRLRKIRCDKRSPCSNCRSSQIVCRTTGAGQKPREPRRRVLISDQYEKKIDLIEDRLSSIEQVLRDVKSTITSSTPAETCFHATPDSGQMTPAASGLVPDINATLDQHESGPAFEGNSSLAAHSAYASQFLETAVSRSALQLSSPTISTALSTLKQLVNMQDNQAHPSSRDVRFPNQKPIPRSGLRNMNMPPVQVVLPLLRHMKENPSTILLGFFPFITADSLFERCRQVYFATEEYSDATFIVVNACLVYLFSEFSFSESDTSKREIYDKYHDLCRVNLETGLASLNLLTPATMESIEALSMGAIHAIEISKPSLALALTSTAFRLCQTLGYHRASSMENDSYTMKQNKRRLFWSVYVTEKALSLRLGRASSIQDYDISLPTTFELLGDFEPWRTIYPLWINLARIQGKVYEMLYSPAALCKPADERASYARQLAAEMQMNVEEPFKKASPKFSNISALDEIYLKSDQVCRLSVLTLIYRAIPAAVDSRSTFVDDCIETARVTLELHQGCMTMMEEGNRSNEVKCSYLHWTIMYSPFVPFIVLFCHVIESSSYSDLIRLEDFVNSLQPNCSLSEAIAKMHRLCQVLSNVARLYVEAKAQAQTQENQDLASVGQEFDVYLSALGLAPTQAEAGDVRWNGPVPVPGPIPQGLAEGAEGQGFQNTMPPTTLGSWFSGNQHMMGLLEEDLSLFDPSAWS